MVDIKILLMGPMGAGKSTIGKILSSTLEIPYFDNDTELTAIFGYTPEQVKSMKIDDLHVLESRYLANILVRDLSFVAGVAASVVDDPHNQKLLRSVFSVYLRLPLDQVTARAGTEGVGRQILKEGGDEILIERFKRRDPLYKSCARLTIELGNNSITDAEKIISALNA